MRVALIPPIAELGKYRNDGIHLMLAHLLEEKAYAKYYVGRAKAGDYLILDNSAHEHGKGDPMDMLLDLAIKVKAKEVVVPDVLFDRRGTLQGARDAFKYLRSQEGKSNYADAGSPTLMLVPQGNSRKDWKDCLVQLLNEWKAYCVYSGADYEKQCVVIGVSKDYDYVRGGIASLIDEVKYAKQVLPRIQVHCLGWPANLWSIADVMRRHPWVRSTDSAKPFVYAVNEILLEPGGPVPEYPHRNKDYFFDPLNDLQAGIAVRNIEVYVATAQDEVMHSPVDETE